MTNDTVGRIVLLLAVFVFSLVALNPGFVIRVLSYGRRRAEDINGQLLKTTRAIAAISAICGAVDLVMSVLRQ